MDAVGQGRACVDERGGGGCRVGVRASYSPSINAHVCNSTMHFFDSVQFHLIEYLEKSNFLKRLISNFLSLLSLSSPHSRITAHLRHLPFSVSPSLPPVYLVSLELEGDASTFDWIVREDVLVCYSTTNSI